jgi:hypothetical protein
MSKRVTVLLPVFFGVAVIAGCASTQSTTTRTETTYEPVQTEARPPDSATVRRTESTETHTTTDSGHSGVLSGTVDFVGDVIAMPFRFVGGLIDFVF